MAENKRIASEETLVRVATALESMANIQNVNLIPKTWKEVQNIVRNGLAAKAFAIGDQFVVEKAKSATATINGTGVTAATVDVVTFVDKIGTSCAGLYDFEYNGAAWLYIGKPVILSQYGITTTGTAAKNDHIIISVVTESLVFDVIGIDHDTPSDTQFKHSLTLQMHNCAGVLQFGPTEALFYAENELPAGTYNFTLLSGYDATYGGGKTYQFTLTNPVPAGGQICFPWAYQTQASACKIKVYASKTSTVVAEEVSVTEGSEGTDLATIATCNHTHRIRYGSNNWEQSAMRQWLNSSKAKGNVWEPKTNFDRPPAWFTTEDGFLKGIDKEFLSAVGKVKKTTALNMVSDGGGSTESDELMFLLSFDELYFGKENNTAQGTVYDYYKNYSSLSAAGSGEDSNRIKYYNGTAKYWWMRSPHPWDASNVRIVSPRGALGNGHANTTYGVVPACCIV